MVAIINVPVIQRRQLSGEILEVTCHLDGKEFPFKAGQNIQVTLSSLIFEDQKGKTRTFNILSSPNNSEYLSFAFHMSDSGFKKTLKQIPENSEIQIKGPFGLFTMPESNQEIIFIAEDIGIVPVIGMLLFATEEKRQNKITLIYSGKGKITYDEDIKSIEKINPKLSVKTKVGSLESEFIKNNIYDFQNILFYLSGTSETVSKIKPILLKNGVDIKNLKIEEFVGY